MFEIGNIARLLILSAFALTGCTSTRRPISTSLLDITGESRVTKLKSRSFPWFPLFEQHEAFSVNGLLHMPEVGQEFHFPGRGDPTSAIGIAVAQSYKLIGESEVPSSNDVLAVRTNLDEVQFLTLRLVAQNADINRLRVELRALSTNGQESASATSLATNITMELTTLVNDQTATRSNLFQAQARLRQAASTPGIIVARWQATNTVSASAGVGSIGNASIGAGKTETGFVVLGGVRFVSIVYGEDFWWLLNNLRRHEQDYVREFGVTTYLIQARLVAYTSQLDLSRLFAATAKASHTDFTVPTSVEAKVALEQLAQFGNSGNLGHIAWKREPYCFVCGIDLPQLATNKYDKVIQQVFNAEDRWPDKVPPSGAEFEPSFQGWRTVVAKVAHVGRATATRLPPLVGKRIWEHYKDPRRMHGAPTCPICGGQTNAVIPGWSEPRSAKHCQPDSHKTGSNKGEVPNTP
jgi:hypothetical protein